MATVVTSSSEQQQRCNKNGNSTSDDAHQATSLVTSTSSSVVYDVEHLATFSTAGSHETQSSNDRLALNDGDGASKCFNTTAAANSSPNNNNETLSASSSSSRSATVANSTNNIKPTTTPKIALQRLFELEKQSGIWTQRMQIKLQDDYMLIVDCETNSVVERFERECVTKPEAFNEYNDIYNNILVFIIQQSKSPASQKKHENEEAVSRSESDTDLETTSLKSEEGELHIFQCVSHEAQQLVLDILSWKIQQSCNNMADSTSATSENSKNDLSSSNQRDFNKKINSKQPDQDQKQAAKNTSTGSPLKHKLSPISYKSLAGKPVVTVASSSNTSENVPIVNVNVKETVQVFNQIAALREKSKATSPINPRPLSDASATSSQSNQASNNSNSSTATNGLTDTTAGSIKGAPLSTNGHFYKQQSIRATLAPKYVSGHESPNFDGALEPSSSGSSSKAINQSNTTTSNTNNKSSSSASSAASSFDQPPLLSKSSAHHLDSSHSNDPYQVSKHHSSSSQRVVEQKSKTHHHHHHHQQQQQKQLVSEVNNIQSSVSRQQASQTSHSQHQHSHHKSNNKSLQSRGQQQRTSQQSGSSRSHASSQSQLDQVSTNESYVSVLNHCFDDIEKFITRLQQAVAGQTALRDIQSKRKSSKRSSGNRTTINNESTQQSLPGGPLISASELAILNSKARGPTEDDYFEILSKFKLAFNLLAKLKGCIHEPNAPELVHFLFTPLVIIIESARNATPSIDPTLVGIPYLNQDALDLLSNCCTSKESDVWISLGPNWTQTIDANILKASRLPSSFQPIFSDGWAPIIGELELIGLIAPSTAVNQHPICVPVNPASVSSDCIGSSAAAAVAVADDGSNYRHRHRGHGDGRRNHVSSSYALDELNANSSITSIHPLDSGYSAGMSNGRSVDGLNSHISGRDYNKKRNAPAPTSSSSHGRRLAPTDGGMVEPGSQSYLNSMPYDYINDPNNVLDSHELLVSPGHRGLDNSLGNLRSFNQPVNGRQSRSIKTTNLRHPEMPLYPGFDPTANYHPMNHYRDDGRPDIDPIAHHNASTLHYDDYNELPENYLDDHHISPKNLPGPSNHYHREDKDHSKYTQHHKGHKSPYNQNHSFQPYDSEYLSETEHEAMLLDLGAAQTEWFFELQARGAMIVRVLFTREANNDKELSVRRGEILEVLDDTRKWWRTRNIDLQVAHVPHTIVAIMHGYQTLEELLIENPGDFDGKDSSIMTSQQYTRRELLQPDNYNRDQWRSRDDRRGSKTSGPFRYF